jgi:hypothetical protein
MYSLRPFGSFLTAALSMCWRNAATKMLARQTALIVCSKINALVNTMKGAGMANGIFLLNAASSFSYRAESVAAARNCP